MIRTLSCVIAWMTMMAVGTGAIACQGLIANQVTISSSNRILWNGSEIDRPTLIRYILVTGTMNPIPKLFVDYDPRANCGIVRNTFKSIARASGDRWASFGTPSDGTHTGHGCSVPIQPYSEDTRGFCGSKTSYILVRRH